MYQTLRAIFAAAAAGRDLQPLLQALQRTGTVIQFSTNIAIRNLVANTDIHKQ